MKKFIIYDWFSGDEGGQGVCLASEYVPNFNGYITEKIGEFDNIDELADILWFEFPDGYANYQIAYQEAESLFKRR